MESALKAHEEEITLEDEDLFDGFDPSQYEDEARERWGGTSAYEESERRVNRYGKAEWTQIKAESAKVNDDFVALMGAGTSASSPEAAAVAEAHREHISRWFYDCSAEIHVGLGRMYTDDPRFTATYEGIHAGLAVYVRDAILANAGVA